MWSDWDNVAGCELYVSKDHHIKTFTSVQMNLEGYTMVQNKEQSSCNKMHNVLASYLSREARFHSHLANRSIRHLPVLFPMQ